jgi:hypothetical protein
MSDDLYCAFCGHVLTHYGTGRSDFPYNCDACNAGFATDPEAGVARARVWDRKLARGVHSEFPLAKLSERPPDAME